MAPLTRVALWPERQDVGEISCARNAALPEERACVLQQVRSKAQCRSDKADAPIISSPYAACERSCLS